jgi:ferritin
MSAWCSYHSFEGAAAFLRRHAQEEMTHMQRLFDYLTDTGSLPRIETVASPLLSIILSMNCSAPPTSTSS